MSNTIFYLKHEQRIFLFRACCLLVGPPGTGKTLSANVIAKILGFPLISVDTALIITDGAIYLKRLLERVEACAPVMMYFDEFDKLFAASKSSGEDVSSRQILGTLLTWLQDKTSAVFVVATLNRRYGITTGINQGRKI